MPTLRSHTHLQDTQAKAQGRGKLSRKVRGLKKGSLHSNYKEVLCKLGRQNAFYN